MCDTATIGKVKPGSLGDELGLTPGDRLLAINGQPVKDIIDYRLLLADEEITLLIEKPNGEQWELEFEKDYDEDLGIEFVNPTVDQVKHCANRCIFCFVDQMAPNRRPTLYIKDDDYRLSFLSGNFVTLTNLSDSDLDRIIRLHMSPLYVSVHTTEEDLRVKMMTNPKARHINAILERLQEAGIILHTQIVLCPEVNDKEHLDKTIFDLSERWPNVRSIAVVPVGLTRFREKLYPLRVFTGEEAGRVIDQVAEWQKRFIAQFDYPLVWASDEFYVLARRSIPSYESYRDFPQTENGVGLSALFLRRFHERAQNLPKRLARLRTVSLVTGVSGHYVLNPLVERLNQIPNLDVRLFAISNQFFGETVTVTGLVTGSDIITQLKGKVLGDAVLVPDVMLRDEGDVFLDDTTPGEVAKALGVPVKIVSAEGDKLIDAILE